VDTATALIVGVSLVFLATGVAAQGPLWGHWRAPHSAERCIQGVYFRGVAD
jgi:hypothetical protein